MIAVIGAGPAGLSCAYYLAVKGYPVTVFEKEPVPGGMLTLGIPTFRLEKDVVNAEIDVLRELGVEFRCGVEVGKDVTLDALRADGYKALLPRRRRLRRARRAGCPGDDLKGVFGRRRVPARREPRQAPDHRQAGRRHRRRQRRHRRRARRRAPRRGRDDVLYRRSREEMPAADEEVAEAEAEGVKFRFLSAPGRDPGRKGQGHGHQGRDHDPRRARREGPPQARRHGRVRDACSLRRHRRPSASRSTCAASTPARSSSFGKHGTVHR